MRRALQIASLALLGAAVTTGSILGGRALFSPHVAPAALTPEGIYDTVPTPLCSTTGTPITVPWTCDLSTTPLAKAGAIEVCFTASSSSMSAKSFAVSLPLGQAGNIQEVFLPTSNELDLAINLGGSGGTQVQATRIDLRKVVRVGSPSCVVQTWGPIYSAGAAAGTLTGQAVQDGQQGVLEQPTLLGASDPQIGTLSSIRFGVGSDGSSLSGITFQRFAVYNQRLNAAQVRAMEASARGLTTYRAAFLGDSITAFPDGDHALAQQLCGAGCAYANWGRSGDTVAKMLARLADITPVQWDALVFLGGINDIAFNGSTAVATETPYAEVVGWAKLHATTVLLLSTTPIKNTTQPNGNDGPWDSAGHLTQQTTLFNPWILARPGVTTLDAYSLFNTGADGSFCSFTSGTAAANACSYDGVHPRGKYANAPASGTAGSDTLAAAVDTALGNPRH